MRLTYGTVLGLAALSGVWATGIGFALLSFPAAQEGPALLLFSGLCTIATSAVLATLRASWVQGAK